MRIRTLNVTLISAMSVLAACAERSIGTSEQAATAPPAVRVAEFHYDNGGADVDEKIEISAPAGTSLSGWKILLYNGNPTLRNVYNTLNLSGVVPATCGTRGVVVVPATGMQNGGSATTPEPDGLALVDNTGKVIQFLSYEGSFVAAAGSGEAGGTPSTDIGVSEVGNEPGSATVPVLSLQFSAQFGWSGPKANTFGACNDNDELPPQNEVASVTVTPSSATVAQGETTTLTAAAFDAASQPVAGVVFTWTSSDPTLATVNSTGIVTGVAPGDVTITAAAPNGVHADAAVHIDPPPPPPPLPVTRISEIHYDNLGTDANEAVEIEGPAGTDLTGWSVVLYNGGNGGAYNTRALSGSIPASCGERGVVVLFYPQDGLQNGSPDGLALVDAGGHVVEFLSYEGTFAAIDGPAAGTTARDIVALEISARPGLSLQRNATGDWALFQGSVGLCNGAPTPANANIISFSGRVGNDVQLPVGYEDQLFGSEATSTGTAIPTTFTWTSETPDVATIDQNGVVHALAAGTAVVRATAADGTTGTHALPLRVAVASETALYANNTEFGVPADGDDSDDFVIAYPQYTTSFSHVRGTPNWVAYELDPTHFGAEDRCDCFTYDPQLPASYARYTTADYTGAGTFHGYGIDRGHLARSFDRTTGSLDNARTFLFSNIVPQAADLNQGPWALFENFLGDQARLGTAPKEVYIIAGVAGSKGTVKDEGKITIPKSTWKVAVIMPHDKGLADVHDYRDLTVIAVNMPNDPGVRSVPWQTYQTTVDAIEALTGYDLLALLPDKVEAAVESNTRPPFAFLDGGPYTLDEGGTIAASGSASFDSNGTVVGYAWDFGDGETATGAEATHTYAQDGFYTVTLTVIDNDGLTDTVTTTATVANVAPSIDELAGATLLPGETYATTGAFTDPGADPWTATADYGDGSPATELTLDGMTFSLAHVYAAAGIFTVTVVVADDDTTSQVSQVITVLTQTQAIRDAIALIDGLVAAGKITSSKGVAINSKLAGAIKDLGKGDVAFALDKLVSAVDQIDALVRSGKLSAADAAPVRTLLVRIIVSLSR